MAEPEADRCDVDEAQEAFGCLVVAGGDPAGVLQLVEAPLNEVTQAIEPAVDGHTELSRLPHRNDCQNVAGFHGLPDGVGIVAAIREQDARLGQVVDHDQIEPEVVRCLPRRDPGFNGQACRIDAQVDLGREPTS